uniref:Cell division cycle protein 27 homolog n=1 Tax=Lygus hesperus TaxID=30085 RepID=A0A0A9WWG3_LYGHE
MIVQNYSKSIECYRKATSYSPIQYRAWYGLASLYYKQERHELARYYIAYALEINTRSTILWIFSAIILYACGETQLALNCLHHAHQVDPSNPLPLFQRAIIFYDQQRYEEALQILLDVMHLTPNEANVHFLLGNIYRQLNNPLSALKHLYRALDIDKKNSTLI